VDARPLGSCSKTVTFLGPAQLLWLDSFLRGITTWRVWTLIYGCLCDVALPFSHADRATPFYLSILIYSKADSRMLYSPPLIDYFHAPTTMQITPSTRPTHKSTTAQMDGHRDHQSIAVQTECASPPPSNITSPDSCSYRKPSFGRSGDQQEI
jgi:hypothetical protein